MKLLSYCRNQLSGRFNSAAVLVIIGIALSVLFKSLKQESFSRNGNPSLIVDFDGITLASIFFLLALFLFSVRKPRILNGQYQVTITVNNGYVSNVSKPSQLETLRITVIEQTANGLSTRHW